MVPDHHRSSTAAAMSPTVLERTILRSVPATCTMSAHGRRVTATSLTDAIKGTWWATARSSTCTEALALLQACTRRYFPPCQSSCQCLALRMALRVALRMAVRAVAGRRPRCTNQWLWLSHWRSPSALNH